MNEQNEYGNICHVEIPVPDLQKAVDFYSTIFGWSVNLEAIPDYGLTMDREVSVGLSLADNFQAERLGIYIEVKDIDETLAKIESNGGSIVSEKNLISDSIGFGARFSDPFGNSIGLFAEE